MNTRGVVRKSLNIINCSLNSHVKLKYNT